MPTTYDGRNAIVLGLGLTGFSLARHLAARGARVTVADTRFAPPYANALREALPAVRVVTGAFSAATFEGADLIAISPGVPRDEPAIAAAVARGTEIVGDIELFARLLPAGQKVLAITGSNGKTTVTALTGALCRAAGLSTVVAGNIGNAVLDVVEPIAAGPGRRAWPDAFVLELSSFQLETTTSLRPTAATVLNVTDNHLDRYAGMDEYAAAKRRIFEGGGAQVLNRNDPRSIAMAIPGRPLATFGSGAPAGDGEWGLAARGGKAGDLWLAHGDTLLAPVSGLALLGRHNAQNALAALALVSAVAPITPEIVAALLRFEGLPHRMQRIGEAGDVLYVNDSKGTTVAATRVALEGLGRPVVLIAGGDGKGQDFAPLKALVDAHCRAVLLIGRDAPLIARALAGTAVPVETPGTLDAAVTRAVKIAQPGDAVVLSPACASLDQFSNYVERGERFATRVRAHLSMVGAHA